MKDMDGAEDMVDLFLKNKAEFSNTKDDKNSEEQSSDSSLETSQTTGPSEWQFHGKVVSHSILSVDKIS